MLPSDLAKYKEKSQKIIALTAWDCISGSLAEQANVDLVLVGDSLAMVCLGYKSTLPFTLENIIYHTNAVSRGFTKKIEEQPLVVSDMPFLTYQCGSTLISKKRHVRNYQRLFFNFFCEPSRNSISMINNVF